MKRAQELFQLPPTARRGRQAPAITDIDLLSQRYSPQRSGVGWGLGVGGRRPFWVTVSGILPACACLFILSRGDSLVDHGAVKRCWARRRKGDELWKSQVSPVCVFDPQARQEQTTSRRGVAEAPRQPRPAALPAEHPGCEFAAGPISPCDCRTTSISGKTISIIKSSLKPDAQFYFSDIVEFVCWNWNI